MREYLFEMHAHTSEVSPCAQVPACEVVERYIGEGYDGLVITDHMSPTVFAGHSFDTWEEKVSYFLTGYRKARDAARGRITVLFGMEIAFQNETNDYLVYGITEKFLLSNPDNIPMGFKRFSQLAAREGLPVFQAHPFRIGMKVANWRLLDGIEVYNGNSSHNSNNDIARLWAQKHRLRMLSGSDFHRFFGASPGGVYFPKKINGNRELVAALKENDYRLK